MAIFLVSKSTLGDVGVFLRRPQRFYKKKSMCAAESSLTASTRVVVFGCSHRSSSLGIGIAKHFRSRKWRYERPI